MKKRLRPDLIVLNLIGHRAVRLAVAIAGCALIGACPGLLLWLLGWPTGEAIAVFGGVIGALIAVPRNYSLNQLQARLVATHVLNLFHSKPGVPDEVTQSRQRKLHLDDPLTRWLTKPSEPRREWSILACLLFGAIAGPAFCLWDHARVQSGRAAYVLQEITPKDSLFGQTLLFTTALMIWAASVAALFVSSTYRKWILSCSSIGAVGAWLIALNESARWSGIVSFATIGAALALFNAWLLHRIFEPTGEDPDELEERNWLEAVNKVADGADQSVLGRIFDDPTYFILGLLVLGPIVSLFIRVRSHERSMIEPAPDVRQIRLEIPRERPKNVSPQDWETAVRATRILMGEKSEDVRTENGNRQPAP